MSTGDAIKIVLVLGLTGGLLALLRWFQVRREPPPEPELVRKLFHIGGGLLSLSLPWLFDSLIPVLLTSGAIAALFIAMRKVPLLRDGVGQVLLGVKRNTVGEFCYVASVCLLFWLTHGNKLLYSVPLLVLAIADASAALIGEQYGKLPLHKGGDRKSYEGAAAFALATFFCVHVPVLLSGQSGRLESLLIAAGVGVMVMMAEVAAWWGIDNIIIPLWTYMLLKSLLQMDATTMSTHLAFVLALALFMRFYRRHTTLGDDALFGATLWGYVVWIVGGWQWVLPPLIQLVTYARSPRRPRRSTCTRSDSRGAGEHRRRLPLAADLPADRRGPHAAAVYGLLRSQSRDHRAGAAEDCDARTRRAACDLRCGGQGADRRRADVVRIKRLRTDRRR